MYSKPSFPCKKQGKLFLSTDSPQSGQNKTKPLVSSGKLPGSIYFLTDHNPYLGCCSHKLKRNLKGELKPKFLVQAQIYGYISKGIAGIQVPDRVQAPPDL